MSSADELERRIAELERLAEAASEAAQPNYLTIDPATLAVGARFTGLIEALGIVLPARTSGLPQPDSQVAWKQAADGAVIATIEGSSTNTSGIQNAFLELDADTHTNPGGATVLVEAKNVPLTTFAALLVQASGPPEIECDLIAQVKGTSGITFTKTILDDLGQSGFLQLHSTQQLEVVGGGPTAFVYPGGTNQSNALVVSHNIGRDPSVTPGAFVLGLPNGAYGAGQAPSVSCSATSMTTATFVQTLPVGVNPAAGNFGNLFWVVAA